MEKKSNKIYGKDGRVEHESVRDARRAEKKAEKAAKSKVKKPAVAKMQSEDYQTPERAATTRRAVRQAKTLDWYERTSPHTYGKGGRRVKKAKTKRALSARQKVNGFLKSLYK